MNNAPLDLNLFRVFDAVYRAGSITRAAGRLHVTQPAVSNALARLRERLGDPLFVREGQRMVPTPRAKAMAPEVEAALHSLDRSLRREERFDPAAANRRFVVAMRDAMELPMLSPLMAALAKRAPGVRVHSVPLDRKIVTRQLAAGEVDFAVDVPFTVSGELRQRPLFAAELCLAMRRDHPLRKKPLTLERWLGARHVAVSGRAAGPVLEDLALQRLGVEREVAVRCQNYYAACRLVAETDLVVVLPRAFAAQMERGLPLRLSPLPFPAPSLQVVLYEGRAAGADPGHAWFGALLVELAAGAAASSPRRRARGRA